MITVRLRMRVRVGARTRVRSRVRSRLRVRKLLASVPLEAICHHALQPRDRAALLLRHELAEPGLWRQGQG